MNNIITKYSKCGRVFTAEEIALIQEIVKDKFHTSRCKISRSVCKKLNWYNESGEPKAWICREFLLQLQKDGLILLPEPRPVSFNRFKKKKFEKVKFTEPEKVFEGNLGNFNKPIFKCVRVPAEKHLLGIFSK